MKSYEEVELKEYVTKATQVGCNKCGITTQLSDEDEINNEWSRDEFQEFNCSFGYGSRYDSQRWSFDLCDDCLTELIKTFKHVPDGFGEDSYCAVHPQLTFEHWKETGDVDLEFGMTSEEIAERGGSIYVELDEKEMEEEE